MKTKTITIDSSNRIFSGETVLTQLKSREAAEAARKEIISKNNACKNRDFIAVAG